MRKKTMTLDCQSCQLMKIDEKNQFLCRWGNGKPKILLPQKGKKPLNCKLKR